MDTTEQKQKYDHRKIMRELSLQGETWRRIPFASIYWVSNYGRIYGEHNHKISNLDYSLNYARLNIKLDIGIYRHYMIHRLVAMMFCPGYSDDCEVHHIDTDQRNNCAWNLVPTTPRQHDIIHDQIRKQRKKTA